MALNLTSPVTETKTIAGYKILEYQHNNLGGVMTIVYSEVYSDNSFGDKKTIRIEGEDYTKLVSDNSVLYGTMKTTLYGILQAKLEITGTIV